MPPPPRHGRYHDLDAILRELRAAYFPASGPVTIGWGRWSGQAPRRSMRFGAYFPDTCHIRIHPALDQAFVPRFFVAFIVYHELLHHFMPAIQVNGRQYVHTKAFRQRERAFPRYAEAVAWRQRHLRQLLASTKSRSAPS
jgi:hypothetical protein